MSKYCHKCKQDKPVSDYWVSATSKTGLQSYCKQCQKTRQVEYQKTKKGKSVYLASVKKYRKTDKGRANHHRQANLYRARHPEKTSAKNIVKLALASGKISKSPCVKCGSTKNIEGHHKDYSKPLDVTWLCTSHHNEVTQEVRHQVV
jgi:hypothetical protein